MQEIKYTITDPEGIHARPAGLLVKQAAAFGSSIKIAKGDKEMDLKRLLGVMSLGVKQGDEVTIKIEGDDEAEAVAAIEAFLKGNL